ncbi:MAG: hypothetical protein SGPRY_006475 [Prymnesium sp.]
MERLFVLAGCIYLPLCISVWIVDGLAADVHESGRLESHQRLLSGQSEVMNTHQPLVLHRVASLEGDRGVGTEISEYFFPANECRLLDLTADVSAFRSHSSLQNEHLTHSQRKLTARTTHFHRHTKPTRAQVSF